MDDEIDGMNTGREMDCGIANHVPLEKLIAVAFQFGLLDDWRYIQGCIHLNVGIMGVTLTADDARALLQAMIRRHYLAHCERDGQ